MEAEDVLHDVRKRAVTHVVQKRGRARRRAILFADRVIFAEPVEHARDEMEHAKRVREAGVFRALIGVEREAELLDAAQALKLRRVDEAHEQLPFARVGAQADDVVDGVAVDAFAH